MALLDAGDAGDVPDASATAAAPPPGGTRRDAAPVANQTLRNLSFSFFTILQRFFESIRCEFRLNRIGFFFFFLVVTPCSLRSVDNVVEDGMASFTNQPPGDLHRPRAVRHPSPTSPASPTSASNSAHPLGYQMLPVSSGVSGSKLPLKRTSHTSTGQHLHVTGSRISGVLASASGRPDRRKKTEGRKSVTFQTDVRLKSDAFKLPVVFETETEDNGNANHKVTLKKKV